MNNETKAQPENSSGTEKMPELRKAKNIVEYKPEEYDVIVIGAGYGGVISGAILAKNGLKTVIVDQVDQVGGKTGSVNHGGYWFDFGQQDTHDVSDVVMIMGTPPQSYGLQAAEAAGAEIKMVEIEGLRGHVYPGGEIADLDLHSMDSIGNYLVQTVGVPEDKLAQFLALIGEFVGLDPLEYRDVIIADWLRENVVDREIHKYLYRYLLQLFARPPENASVGRMAEFFASPGFPCRANDPDAGGMQGFIKPYERVFRQHRGKIMLEQTPAEIMAKGGKVKGIVIVDKAGNVQELRAPVVIFSWAVWYILDLIEEGLLPGDLVKNARKLENEYDIDTVFVNMGLSRLPTVKTSGKQDDYASFQRVVVGPDRDYGGGWLLSSLATPTVAPLDKHLITFMYCSGGSIYQKHPPFKSFSEAKEKITSRTVACARNYYADLDQITEWTSFKYHKAPSQLGWCFSPIEKAPVKCPSVEGLYFVSGSTEVSGLYQDIDAHAALLATNMILK
jgi:phytoene dehydrogenase-like protein